MSAFISRLTTNQPIGPTSARLNPGGGGVPPFATVQLAGDSYMIIYTPEEAYALRDVFQQAGDGLAGVTP